MHLPWTHENTQAYNVNTRVFDPRWRACTPMSHCCSTVSISRWAPGGLYLSKNVWLVFSNCSPSCSDRKAH